VALGTAAVLKAPAVVAGSPFERHYDSFGAPTHKRPFEATYLAPNFCHSFRGEAGSSFVPFVVWSHFGC
jgi:hypothetical protein